MITHLDHLVLTVSDIEQSIAFYQRVLHMKPITFGVGRRALRFGQQKINLQLLGQEKRNYAHVGSGDICLITNWNVADLLAHLQREQITILQGPVQKSGAVGSIISIYFNDPDGNLIEVSRYENTA